MANITVVSGTDMNYSDNTVNNYFDTMVTSLRDRDCWAGNTNKKTISSAEYDLFCKEFVFDQLKGIGFGVAFCKRFNINDMLLNIVSDDTAKFHIEKLGYIK